jgi:hypothetical protein
MSVQVERLARNQVLFREVNERLRELLDGSIGQTEFLCECSNPDCTETLPLEVAEYERARALPTRFLVVPGHENPGAERVVWRSDRYNLVELDAEYAVITDPRSRERSAT